MKKILLCVLLLASVFNAHAIKALRIPSTYTQSDGTKITVYLNGDENFAWYTDDKGNILERKGNDFTPIKISKSLFFSNAKKNLPVKREPVANSSTLFPHVGSPKALVILVNFTDTTFSLPNPKKSFDYYLNGKDDASFNYANGEKLNYGNVRAYFEEMSGGKFTPQFDIVGPVSVDKPLSYYGRNTNNVPGRDQNYTDLITDAMSLVGDSVNFADYDSNNDGYIDLVYVIYAGYGENLSGNDADCLWPKSFNMSSSRTYGGKRLYRCGISNELNGLPGVYTRAPYKRISGTGLFIHEFSHCLGLPDFYVTADMPADTQNANNQEMETWSIMDAGCYNPGGWGTRPAAYTAWEREAFGWSSITNLTERNKGLVTLKPLSDGGTAYRVTNDNNTNEYYVLENIQQTGWNGQAYGHGMLAIHVNYDRSAFSLSQNRVNGTFGQPRMTVVAADGVLLNSSKASDTRAYYASLSGDPFPGTSNNTFLTDTSSVKPIVYKQSVNYVGLNKPIFNISENSDGVITFYYLQDKETTAIKETAISESNEPSDIYNLSGLYVGKSTEGLPAGIYIRNGKKIIIR